MFTEKRMHARFLPPQNTFAVLGKEYTKIGKLINISQGGIAFEYLAGDDEKIDCLEVDIFCVGNVFHLYNVPCKIVYDIKTQVPYVYDSLVKQLTTKKCGIKFVKLSEDNLIQLKLVIDNNSKGACNLKNI